MQLTRISGPVALQSQCIMSPLMNALLEREAPLAQLNALARRVVRGGPGEVVLLRGEAGVGKTALLARFADQRRTPAAGAARLV